MRPGRSPLALSYLLVGSRQSAGSVAGPVGVHDTELDHASEHSRISPESRSVR